MPLAATQRHRGRPGAPCAGALRSSPSSVTPRPSTACAATSSKGLTATPPTLAAAGYNFRRSPPGWPSFGASPSWPPCLSVGRRPRFARRRLIRKLPRRNRRQSSAIASSTATTVANHCYFTSFDDLRELGQLLRGTGEAFDHPSNCRSGPPDPTIEASKAPTPHRTVAVGIAADGPPAATDVPPGVNVSRRQRRRRL
jgi:hypothetical protein